MLTLDAQTREKGNLGALRKKGFVPAVFYGPGKPTTMIAVTAVQFGKVLAEAGESTVISLKTKDGAIDALIHDVTHDPVTGVPVHVDFYLVSKDKKIQVNVPLEFTGVAQAERIGGAVNKAMHDVRVEALPGKLPQHITVDLGLLVELHSHISLKDLVLPEGVRVIGNENDTVVGVTAQHEEKEETPAAATDLSAIEVEKKGKTEEEGAAPAEGEAKK
jgi:large subunit ribosomal protein L25